MSAIASRIRILWDVPASQWRLPLAAALLLPLLLAAACGGGGGGDAVKDLLQILPRDADGMLYVDTRKVLDDDDLRGLRRAVESAWDDTEFSSDYGIYLRDLSYVAFAEIDSADLFVLGGLGDPDDLRDELDDQGYDEDEIRDVEVWVDTGEYWEALAFLPNGSVLVAEEESVMEDVLRRRDRGSSSLYDEVEGVVSSLSSGLLLGIGTDCSFTDCTAVGFSFEKKDLRDVKALYAGEFESDRDAARAFEILEDSGSSSSVCDDLGVSRNGRQVKRELTCDLDVLDEFEFDF